MVKMLISGEETRDITMGRAVDTIRLLKQVDNIIVNGKIFRYSDSGLELTKNGDTLVVALEELK